MARKTHTEAQARYDKVNRRVYGFRLHNVIDADIIAKLASVDSMQGYIKQLVRDDIARTCSVHKNSNSAPDLSIITPQEKIRDVINQWAEYKGLTPEEFIKQLQDSVSKTE